MTETPELTPAEIAVAVAEREAELFMAGVKCASIAMKGVLALKVDVGVLNEKLAQSIFEQTGEKLDAALNAHFKKEDRLHNEVPVS